MNLGCAWHGKNILYEGRKGKKEMSELFDELDENGNLTGNVIDRDKAHKVGAWHRAVLLCIINSMGQVFMQKRSATKKLWGGCWDVACGGHIEAGEFGLPSIIREAREELGIELIPSDIHYVSCIRSDNKTDKRWDRHFNEYYIAFIDLDVGAIKTQAGEVDEVRWMDYADFKDMVKSRSPQITAKWSAHDTYVKYLDKHAQKGI